MEGKMHRQRKTKGLVRCQQNTQASSFYTKSVCTALATRSVCSLTDCAFRYRYIGNHNSTFYFKSEYFCHTIPNSGSDRRMPSSVTLTSDPRSGSSFLSGYSQYHCME